MTRTSCQKRSVAHAKKIENNRFSAEIDEHGCQLTHLVNKQGNFDYIWNNDIWPKHAPILFPAIGRSNDDAI
ncbi:hypothetical protein [Lentilactobacillus rapi]|uniref:hypothetical protein n=1 Tax=Lentilactobacillus rapi TaxID=481723 RepID=UPI003BF490EE